MPNEVKEAVNFNAERQAENATPLINEVDLRQFHVIKSGDIQSLLTLPELQLLHSENPVIKPKTQESTSKGGDGDPNTYEVKKDDTLWEICKRHLEQTTGSTATNLEILQKVKAVADLNKLDNPDCIEVGQVIKFEDQKVEDDSAEENSDSTIEDSSNNPSDESSEETPDETAENTQEDEEELANSSVEFVENSFEKFDIDGDGRLTRDEIDNFAEFHTGEQYDSQKLDLYAIARHMDDLKDLSDDDGVLGAFKDDGVTKEDLAVAIEKKHAAWFAEKHLADMDLNKDGKVNYREILSFKPSESEAESYAMLKKHYVELRESIEEEDGIFGISAYDVVVFKNKFAPHA